MAGASLRVLLLEDNPADAKIIERTLRRAGYDVTCAVADSRERFENLLNHSWDLVISDYTLPDYDGLSGLDEVRRRRGDLPYIIVSGTIGEERAVETLLRGANDCIVKDHMDRLPHAVERILRERALRQQRDQAEKELRESEALYRTLVEAIPHATIRKNLEGRYVFVNQQFCELVNLPAEEIIGKSSAAVLPSQFAEQDEAGDRQVLESHATFEALCELQLPSGKTRIIQLAKSPVMDSTGQCVGVQSILWDVTDRVELERQLHQAQKFEALGQLAGGVAHDFNNLLTVINGLSQSLMQDYEPGDEVYEQLKLIYQAGERAARLTRHLLTFSRKRMSQQIRFDLNHLLAETVPMLRRLIGEPIEVTLAAEENLPEIKGDPGQVEQIILNLAVNARDAMPSGGRMTFSTSLVDVKEDLPNVRPKIPAGRFVRLTVNDTGCGMTGDVLAHIFEPFFTTKSPDRGTGLGLATVYGIVKSMGGGIEVRSRVNQGTTFDIYLPVGQEDESAALTPSDRLIPGRGTETILLVDDEPFVRTTASTVLRHWGYDILEAEGLVDAVELAQSHDGTIHLLLCDVVLASGTGPEVARRVQQMRPEIKIVFMSGYDDSSGLRQVPKGLSATYVQKPFGPLELARTIRRVLDGRNHETSPLSRA